MSTRRGFESRLPLSSFRSLRFDDGDEKRGVARARRRGDVFPAASRDPRVRQFPRDAILAQRERPRDKRGDAKRHVHRLPAPRDDRTFDRSDP